MSEARQTVRNAGWLVAQRGLHVLTATLVAMLVPRLMGPGVFGRYALLTSVSMWFAMLSGLDAVSLMTRTVSGRPAGGGWRLQPHRRQPVFLAVPRLEPGGTLGPGRPDAARADAGRCADRVPAGWPPRRVRRLCRRQCDRARHRAVGRVALPACLALPFVPLAVLRGSWRVNAALLGVAVMGYLALLLWRRVITVGEIAVLRRVVQRDRDGVAAG